MKFLNLFVALFLINGIVKAQNFPACDSLVINCCTLKAAGPNTLTLTVANNSSVLFDYPGFNLLNSGMDTIIATETVNYFGVGTQPQVHIMNIISPLNLPFAGYLNLYILFYDTLACSFPVTIPDTVTGIHVLNEDQHVVSVFPNPVVSETVFIEFSQETQYPVTVKITDMPGQLVKEIIIKADYSGRAEMDLTGFSNGVYMLRIEINGKFYSEKITKM